MNDDGKDGDAAPEGGAGDAQISCGGAQAETKFIMPMTIAVCPEADGHYIRILVGPFDTAALAGAVAEQVIDRAGLLDVAGMSMH